MEKQSPDLPFYQVLKLLRELQKTDSFALRVVEKGEDQGTSLIFRSRHSDEEMMANGLTVRKMLGLNLTAHEFRLAFGASPMDDQEIALLTRSMLEILSEAAAGVKTPDGDLQEGRATKRVLPKEFSAAIPKFAIHVQSSDKRPPAGEVYAAVSYHGHWFWIDERDLSSKRGLSFLLGL